MVSVMNLLLIGALALALLVLAWLAGRRRASPPSGDLDSPEYSLRLPPQGLFARCFSAEDAAFVADLRSPAVSGLLFQERRRMAMKWLRVTRRAAGRLYRLHAQAARYAADLRPAAEAGLLLRFGLFQLVYGILTALVLLYGPFRVQALARWVRSLAAVLSGLGGRIAETARPSLAPGVGTASGD